jgi:hypothetical protein
MINPKPMTTYTAPALPTLAEVSGNAQLHDLKKQMPLRWRKSAAVLACVGVMGGSMFFTGCSETNPTTSGGGTTASPTDPTSPAALTTPNNPTEPTPPTCDYTPKIAAGTPRNPEATTEPPYTRLVEGIEFPFVQGGMECRLHYGGSGAANYVVYLTEAEALGFIKARLEEAGLNLSSNPPDYTVNLSGIDDWSLAEWKRDITLELYDAEANVAVASFDWLNTEYAEKIHGVFEEQIPGINVGLFHNAGEGLYNRRDADEDLWLPPAKEKLEEFFLELRPELEEQLTKQIQDFIKLLQEKGILET